MDRISLAGTGGRSLAGHWSVAMAGAVAGAIGAGDAQARSSGDAGGPVPCPWNMEIPCEAAQDGNEGPITPGVIDPCPCGPGAWISTRTLQLTPRAPVSVVDSTLPVNLTTWIWSRTARAEPGHAEASIDFSGKSHFWANGSFTRRASASQSTVDRETWEGGGVPCPRLVSLAATGGAALELSITCAAVPGCSASGSVTIAGSCSSLGDASAHLVDKTVRGDVGYSSHERKLELSGRFGTSIDDDGIGVDGKISSETSWKLTGSGSASGSAAYTVLPDRTYCAFTNRSCTVRSNGNASAVGGGTVSGNGTVALSGLAIVQLGVM